MEFEELKYSKPPYKEYSYKAQIYSELVKVNPAYNEVEIWNKAINICEKAHNERIRNIVSPLLNLVNFLRTKDKNNNKKIEEYMMNEKNLDICYNCIDRLLNITEQ